MRYSQKRVHPGKLIAGLQEVFKGVCLKKPSQQNFALTLLAISVSKSFRINEIASRLPICVRREKSKQKRLLRFLDTPFPCESVMACWLTYVIGSVWRSKRARQQALILIDETDLPGGGRRLLRLFRSATVRSRSIGISIKTRRFQMERIKVIMRSSNISVVMSINRLFKRQTLKVLNRFWCLTVGLPGRNTSSSFLTTEVLTL